MQTSWGVFVYDPAGSVQSFVNLELPFDSNMPQQMQYRCKPVGELFVYDPVGSVQSFVFCELP